MKKIKGLEELPDADDLTPDKRKNYWNQIAFMNYVQHYTIPIKNTWLNIKELDYSEGNKDKKVFRRYIRSCSPDVIVILKEKVIKEKVEKYDLKGLRKKYY